MSTKSPECWGSDPQAKGVRIEISEERSLLLPFDQFLYGELTSDGKEHRLRLIFAMQEVLVRGYNLRRIHLAMQRMELGFLTKLAGSQRSLVAEGQALILEIVVTEATPKVAQI
jgi:hypothetical protein